MRIDTPTLATTENVVKDLAKKMYDSQSIKKIVLLKSNKNPLSIHHPWADISLSHGFPALVCFYVQLDERFPQNGWGYVAHEYILKIGKILEAEGVHDFSLFSGLAGICYAVLKASKQKTRYQNLLNNLNPLLSNSIKKNFLVPLELDIKKEQPSSVNYYDTIQGIVGIGAYCLQDAQNPLLYESLTSIIETLIKRCKPIQIGNHQVPGWYVPVKYQFMEQDKELYPQGNFNLGLAHGIPGVLALLSLAYQKGIQLPFQRQTIRTIVKWIKNHSQVKNGLTIWPDRISFETEIEQKAETNYLYRDAWCYGNPGIIRSLYLAGKALHNTALKKYALSIFKTTFDRPKEEWWLPGPTFCHGISGLLAITNRMAIDTKDPFLDTKVSFLRELLLQFYDSSHPFGFQDLEPTNYQKGKEGLTYISLNKAGLLEGASGIGLALLEIGKKGSSWDAPFLIN